VSATKIHASFTPGLMRAFGTISRAVIAASSKPLM